MEMGTLKERLKPTSVSMTSRATSPIPQASFDTLSKPYAHTYVDVHTPAIRVPTVPIALRMQLEAFEDTPPDMRDRVLPTKATLGEPFALEACREPFAPRTAETIEIVPPHEDGGATPETPVVNLAALEKQIPTGALAENLLWAARSGLDHNKLQGFLNAYASTPNVRISKSAAIIVDSDKHRLISRMRRKPVRQETPGARKASEPGSTWILDGWGPVETGSIENGCYYEWSAACEAIGYELDAQCRDHGHDTVFAFLRHIAAFCAAHNRTWRILRVDAAMRTESFKAQVEAEFGVLVEVAPGGHHEGVALKEATNDINTRASEQMLARAAKGSSYVLPAKRYARHIRNASPPSGSTQSRHHLMTGKPLDLASSPTPLIFGCDIAVLNDEAIRDQKGSGKANRASEGEFIGIDGAAYIIRKFNGQIVRRKNVQPLNESVMMVSGLPGGAVSMNEETQTEGENLGSLPPLAPPPAPIPKPAPTLKPKVLNVNVGDRIEAYYLPWTRGNKRKPAELHEQGEFHAGTITAFRDLDSGSRHHLVMWEGDWKGMGDWLDLANEVRLWRPEPAVAKGHKFYPKQPRAPVSPKAASPKAASKPLPKARPQKAYAAPTADAPRTRARARNYAKIAMVNAVNTFVTEAFRTLGPEHRESFAEQFFECDADDLFVKGTLCTLTRRAQRIIARTAELPDDPTSEHVLICNVARKSKPASSPAMANKADGAVEIVSETGEKTVLRPPTNERARQLLPDAELWIPAFDKARDVLAHAPGNHWMTMSEAKAKGYAITPGVLTNKYKQDPVTGKLEVNNGRKSRIAFDNPRFESIAAKRGESDDTGYGAPVASILQRNITLADACERQRGLTKADVGNAFLLGFRGATMAGETAGARTLKVVIVRMPEGCRLFDPDTGEELVLVCVSPIWGERAAGFEWHMRLLTLLDDAGWQPCPEVPCMFYKTLTCGHDGRLITIVDDLLFSEANMRHDMAEKTVEFLRKQVGKVTMEFEPTFYAGVVIERTFDSVNGHDTLSLSMAEKIHAGTLDVAPQLVRGEAPPLAGKKLVKALHELKPLPVDDRKPKLTKQDRLVGSINGKVQWYKQILPGLSWMQHRLACVIAAPPPEAFDVAVSVLALAYAQREKRVTYTRGLKSSESLLKRYARHIRNASPPSGSTQSRHHLMTGKPLDLASSPTPLIFGCDIAVLNDEAIRDQKGSGKANRASEGEFIGIDGAAYIIRKFNGQIVRRKNVQPLNESVMMVSGLPGGAVSMNEETQTEGENLGSLPPLAPPPAPIPKPAPTLKPKVLNVNVGDRIEAYYLPWTRGNKRKPAELHEQGEFHAGTITAFRDLDSGSRHHLVMWEGDWKGMGDWLDLANEVRLWRPEPAVAKGHKFYPKQPRAPVSPKAASPKAASKPLPKARPQKAYAAPTADAPRTRARARNYAKIAMVNAVNTFVTEAFRTLGPEHRESFAEQFFECDADDLFVKGTLCTLTRRAQRIIARTAELPDDPTSEHVLICNVARKSKPASSPAMANKADGAVEIVSETGEKTVLRPPTNERARQLLPDAELWIPAFDKARDVLAHAPGNHWMTMSEAKAKGYAITPGVLTNKYKQDPVTGKLEVNNGRKSRIAFDNPRFESIAAKRGESDDTGYGAPVASILQRNITLADACERQRGLTKADVGNAFLLGFRGATMAGETAGARTLKVVIVRMPEGCRLFDPDTGEELVLVCVSPIWGERAAGFEWHMRLLTLLDDAGWQPCPEVPCMFYKTLTCGHDGRLITIVDDLLFSEANMRHDMAEKTVEFLRKQVGKVTMEFEPTFYAGVVIERTFDSVNGHDTLSLSMAEKIHAGTLDVAPQLVRGEAPPLAGKKLVKALHELKPLPVDDRKPKLTKQDRLVGSINGKVQWYKQILPGLSWMQHRLACVIAAPPPEAFDVAVSVLALAYAQREKRVTYTRGLKSSESLLKGAMSATIDPTSSACSDTVTIADTSWGVDIEGPFTSGDVYGLTMTRTGAHVYTTTHKLGAVVDCSAHAEAIGTGKAGEITEEARAIERGLGVPPQKPTLILTCQRSRRQWPGHAAISARYPSVRHLHAARADWRRHPSVPAGQGEPG